MEETVKSRKRGKISSSKQKAMYLFLQTIFTTRRIKIDTQGGLFVFYLTVCMKCSLT